MIQKKKKKQTESNISWTERIEILEQRYQIIGIYMINNYYIRKKSAGFNQANPINTIQITFGALKSSKRKSKRWNHGIHSKTPTISNPWSTEKGIHDATH